MDARKGVGARLQGYDTTTSLPHLVQAALQGMFKASRKATFYSIPTTPAVLLLMSLALTLAVEALFTFTF